MVDYEERTSRFEFKRSPDSECLIGPDGCHYENEADAMYYGQLQLCGCGCPEEIHKFLLDCMALRKDDYPNIIDYEKIEQLIQEKPDVVAEFVLHFLDQKEVIEHGGSVYGSWLTKRGQQMLEIGPIQED